MYNPFTLEGKTILVTGASSGIGRSVAVECSKMGAKVVITDMNSERLDETFNLLVGINHKQIVADLTVYEEIENLVENCPNLDGFVNNASITKILFVNFIKESHLRKILNTNTLAPIMLTKLLVRKSKLVESSSIVFISSLAGVYNVHYGDSLFSSSMGAINGFAKGAALDLASKKIRVNCINPGIVVDPDNIEKDGLLSEAELKEKEKFFPLQRFGKPIDISIAAIYFLSEASTWVTGTSFILDGGYTLK